MTNELLAGRVLMLTNAEIWIAVLFCVGCNGLTAGNVNLQTIMFFKCRQNLDKKT
jgi:hypothetical protein